MSNRKKNRKRSPFRVAMGSPIESRCQARGLVTTDRPKQRSKNRCRNKGRSGNPRNRDW